MPSHRLIVAILSHLFSCAFQGFLQGSICDGSGCFFACASRRGRAVQRKLRRIPRA
jgi:hypothetical protein